MTEKPLEYYEIVDNAVELKNVNENRRVVLDWNEFMSAAKIYKALLNWSSGLHGARKKMKRHAAGCRSCEKKFISNEKRLRNINSFFKSLGPSIIACRYRYGKRRMWVTPQWKQMTETYLTMLNRLYKIDTKLVDPKTLKMEDVQKIENNLMHCELLNKSIKEQIQGRQSFVKQEATPGRDFFAFRCTVLPSTSDMDIDEIGIPHEIFPGLLENANRLFVSLTFKRDPVICQYSVHSPEKIRRVDGKCVRIHSYRYKSMNLDIDGDTVVVNVCLCEAVSLELLCRLNCRFNMYVHFGKTRMEFSQTHALRLHDDAVTTTFFNHPRWGGLFRYVYEREKKANKKTVDIYNRLILILVQLYDSATAYEFLSDANEIAFRDKSMDKFLVGNVVDDKVCEAIIRSGAKGDYDIIDVMKNHPRPRGEIEKETLSYARKYIGSNNDIAKGWQTESQLLQILQNVVVESDSNLSLIVGNDKIILGPVDNFMPHSFKMDPLVALLIDDDM